MKGLGVSPSSQFGESYGKIKKTAITTAQLLALRATPVLLTETPPASHMIVLKYAVFSYVAGDTGYTVSTDRDLMIEYTGGTDASLVCLCDNNTGGIDFTGTTSKQILVPSAFPADTMATLAGVLGEALQLDQVGSAEWTLGNGALNVTVVYDVIKVL
jgi:hypothetical protein